jgi:hypothetical protein
VPNRAAAHGVRWPAPNGTKLLIFGYAYQSGDVVTDPSIPITGVDSTIDSGVLAYQQTINLFGRTGKFQFELPYVDGTTTGLVSREPGRRDVSGFGDVAATLSINILGSASMSLAEFQQLRQNPRIAGRSASSSATSARLRPNGCWRCRPGHGFFKTTMSFSARRANRTRSGR